MELKLKIKELKEELGKLEKEYMESIPPCMNKLCVFWNNNHTNKCSWTLFIEDCKEYDTTEIQICSGCGKDLSDLDEYFQKEGYCSDCL